MKQSEPELAPNAKLAGANPRTTLQPRPVAISSTGRYVAEAINEVLRVYQLP